MSQADYTLKLSGTEYAVPPVPGSYTGYYYEDELSVQKLLGKDPARTDKNEVLQSTGKGAKVAELDTYASTTVKDQLVALLWTQPTHDDGIDGSAHNVTVVGVSARVYIKVGSNAAVHTVHLKLRER